MKRVVITSKCTINGQDYNKGDEINVSSSIYTDLVEVQKCAKDAKSKKPKKD